MRKHRAVQQEGIQQFSVDGMFADYHKLWQRNERWERGINRRYDEQYVIAAEIEEEIDGVEKQIRCIRQEKISGDNIYRLLLAFDEIYHSATEVERKEFMKAFIERIDLYPEKRKDGCWIKNIVFNFPIPIDGGKVKEFPLESESTVESVVLLTKSDGES